jgi:hypothetical protein
VSRLGRSVGSSVYLFDLTPTTVLTLDAALGAMLRVNP